MTLLDGEESLQFFSDHGKLRSRGRDSLSLVSHLAADCRGGWEQSTLG